MTADPGLAEVDRDAITGDLRACAEDLHALLASATPDRLNARSHGTKWTNEELLFHMVFGFLVVRRLLPLVRLVSFSSVRGSGPPFAGAARRGPEWFHWVNYARLARRSPSSSTTQRMGPLVRPHHRRPDPAACGLQQRGRLAPHDAVPHHLGPLFQPPS